MMWKEDKDKVKGIFGGETPIIAFLDMGRYDQSHNLVHFKGHSF